MQFGGGAMNRRVRGYTEDVVERLTKRTQKRPRRAAAAARQGLVVGWVLIGFWRLLIGL